MNLKPDEAENRWQGNVLRVHSIRQIHFDENPRNQAEKKVFLLVATENQYVKRGNRIEFENVNP